MQISRVLFNQMCHLFATNSALLGVTDPNQMRVQPVNIAFTPSLDRVLADVPKQGSPLVQGHVPVSASEPPMQFTDTSAGERVVEFISEGTPWAFKGGAGAYPFTIFGTRLVSQDETVLLATETLPAAVNMSAAEQGFDVPLIGFRFPLGMVR